MIGRTLNMTITLFKHFIINHAGFDIIIGRCLPGLSIFCKAIQIQEISP